MMFRGFVVRRAGTLVALTLVAFALLVSVGMSPSWANGKTSTAKIRDRLEYLVNRERVRHGVGRLRVSVYAERYARGHAGDMATRDEIYHDDNVAAESPEGTTAWGENVGRTASHEAARRLHYMFMASSSHRSNILKPRWTHMGIGVSKDDGYIYVTQRFMDMS